MIWKKLRLRWATIAYRESMRTNMQKTEYIEKTKWRMVRNELVKEEDIIAITKVRKKTVEISKEKIFTIHSKRYCRRVYIYVCIYVCADEWVSVLVTNFQRRCRFMCTHIRMHMLYLPIVVVVVNSYIYDEMIFVSVLPRLPRSRRSGSIIKYVNSCFTYML